MLILIICLVFAPTLAGLIPVCLKKRKENITLTEIYMVGVLVIFAVCELIACILIKMEGDFDRYCQLITAGICIICMVSLFAGWKQLRGAIGRFWENIRTIFADNKTKSWRLLELFLILVFICMELACCFVYEPAVGSDVTGETILVTTMTNTIFQYNPILGTALKYGMYPIHKFASLPLLYSSLFRWSRLPFSAFIYVCLPVWNILLAGAVMLLWGKKLFGWQKEKQYLFLIFYHVLILVGDGNSYNYAFGLLHSGWKGEILAAGVIVPFFYYALYQALSEKEWVYGMTGAGLALIGLIFARPLFAPISFLNTPGADRKVFGLFLLAILALYLIREKMKQPEKKEVNILLAVCAVSGLSVVSIMPILGISYICVCIWEAARSKRKAAVLLAGFLFFFCMAGTVLPFGADVPKKWHISGHDREIQNKIEELVEKYEEDGREVYLLAADSVMEQARLRNGYVKLPYGKDLWQENCNREIADVYEEEVLLLHEQMQRDYAQPDAIAAMAVENKCNILVLREKMSPEIMEQHGWNEYDDMTGYALYYR